MPTPSTTRPPLKWSRVAACLATFHGRRRGNGVTIGPSRILLVLIATAARVIQGSAAGSSRLR